MRRISATLVVLAAAVPLACGADGDGASSAGGGASGLGGDAGSAGLASGGAPGGGGSTQGGSGGVGGTSGLGGSHPLDAGGGTDAGADASDGDANDMDGSGGSSCTDPGPEPNESIVLASPACPTPPCQIGDCDGDGTSGYGGPLDPVTGVVGPGDSDHFKLEGKDTLGLCQVGAEAKTTDSGFRLCLFAACLKGSTSVTACPGGTAVDAQGSPGCCTQAPGEVAITHDCAGSPTDDDSAKIVIRVDQANACTPYGVDFHF